MLLRLEDAGVPMKLVYQLAQELKSDPEQVRLAQALTLDTSRPFMGLKGTFGLFGSQQWWSNIAEGKLPLLRVSGIVRSTYVAGQDETEINSMELMLEDGSVRLEGIYANDKRDRQLFRVGHRVEVVYALEELKRASGPPGSANYAEIPLEMAVSLASEGR
jgi:hypothetical protein